MERAGAEQAGPQGKLSPQALCRAIRDDVIRGVHRPGSRLTEESMAARYGVSRVPVREALRTLEAEGFVQSRPYAGIVVVELDDAEAEDLLEVRALLEPLGAGRAALRRTPEQLGRLKELVSLGRVAIEDGRLDEVARLNSRFHEVIAAASGSRTLSQLVTQLSQKISWVYSADLPRRAQDSWREHEEIVAAVERGDAEAAREVVARHIAAARSAYRRRSPGSAGDGS
ncbi:GntR family transcriptional regulator [Kitasatospora sp. NBC_00240]|uniref:GntR family transcriptional regulator n=1 Tax=Kitasatospora sp. NBC_00240 TaxID=2903567 RepID=UPI00225ACF7F|nr:GntR family transcriptional regulator [Kitasatospora sp. NBC_00240]MCX5207956.1 GntR family transcriptional regulator [Kitasatospora sp. NBC_00240]